MLIVKYLEIFMRGFSDEISFFFGLTLNDANKFLILWKMKPLAVCLLVYNTGCVWFPEK